MGFVALHNIKVQPLHHKIHLLHRFNAAFIVARSTNIWRKYMFAIPEQFSNATKANFESQFAIFSSLTSKAFEGIEKLVELNITAAKASLEESTVTARQLLAAKDPQEFFALSAAQAQPNTEKAISYSRQLAAIAAGTQAEFTKAAEEQIAETNRKVISLVDEVSKNAPAGSENVVALIKATVGNANAGYEQLSKTAKQASQALETNVSAAVNQFTQAAQTVAAKAAKK
jgi:phasin family protein